MKIHRMKQRTKEWDAVRAGKITASVAAKFITAKGNPSTQANREIGRIVCEEAGLQEPEFIKPTYWMERGIVLEPEARRWFSVETDLEVTECGFIENDAGDAGISPDCITLDGEQVIPVELKCRKPGNHLMNVLGATLPDLAKAQVHFQIVICDAPYAYYMEYNPNIKPLLLKVIRDDYTEKVALALDTYRALLPEAREMLL